MDEADRPLFRVVGDDNAVDDCSKHIVSPITQWDSTGAQTRMILKRLKALCEPMTVHKSSLFTNLQSSKVYRPRNISGFLKAKKNDCCNNVARCLRDTEQAVRPVASESSSS
jgi:hypothetical protein